MSTDMQSIAERIKNQREKLGYSFQDLATLTDMSKSTLQRYETGGIKNIPLSKLEVLAKALQVTPEYILGWDKEESATGSIERLRIQMEKTLNKKITSEQAKSLISLYESIANSKEN